ncbi:hypothetical protein ZOSMA_146G00450 [Zostera marina]|uniref:Uncharacterized protein n=1 Tax=Zostera marina TaxID=29655 RepID=A0A0K9PXA2_ZOSMR|nr:hypothetical protein ZOSMA_146G00450 [Zostera marina]
MSSSTEDVDPTSPDSTNSKRVGTHNGSFHCDEALGCFMIRLTSKFKDSQIVRSRDPKVLDTLDAVLDVGGVYNPDTDRYDHHQKGFSQVLGHGFETKLSSAGLVYKHYGMEIVAKELQLEQCHENVNRIYIALYKNFIESVDAIDNGINEYDTEQSPKYVNNTYLSSRVSRLNLDWTDPDQSSHKEDQAFQKAMELTGREFLESLRFYVRSWLPARTIVMESLKSRYDDDTSGEIMVFKKFCPWKLHLFELEAELKIDPLIKYVIYKDDRSQSYRIQAVSVAPGKFESRKALPLAWRGMRDDELSNESDIPGCVFVHMSGFIGGNLTMEGAIAMARASL